MKGMGLLLVVIGIAAFLLSNSQRSGYDTVEGKLKTTFSKSENENAKFWDMARWVGVGVAAFGAVMYVRGTRPQ
jgi:hypothetical protein